MIRIENVTKYHEGRVVIDDVTLTIDAHTNVGLIGPGGAGKSVLLKIVCGLITPDRGKVFIDDIDVHSLKPTELAELRFRIGMLFQNYALFDSMNVADNIAFPLRQAGESDETLVAQKVQQALKDISLPGIGDRYPNELSGGMKKRVSFARAVIRRPPIVFYDDPTAGLDPVTSSKIFILLRTMQRDFDTTSVTISHDIEGIKDICDRFVLLDQGRIVFEGTRAEIDACQDSLVSQFWQGYSDDELNV
ncbi:ABC transporter ATP-binding protein [Lujinxingia litoralis]|uniref:ABC transporter ATP-binding protein n=1 Tax=Lujinxingia litoralis TaxID=2211119 RepID=A0A328CA50_9DELT|nr:ATP-binding cassette domain-containing protein [Lujinxingia litoralis]RAL23808.1 ABC transporter ATP-binding protein [Lujinxingia litoralis]